MYVPLRVHGWHSLLTGVDPPERLLDRGRELGLSAMALTDVDTLAGSVEFLRCAATEGRPRALLGAELSDAGGRAGRLIALVRTEQGYRNLCKLVSARHLGGDPGTAGETLDGPESFQLAEEALRFREGLFFLVDHPRLAFALAGGIDPSRLAIAVSPAALERDRGWRPRRRRRARARSTRPSHAEATEDELSLPKVPSPAAPVPARELIGTARALGLALLAVPDVYAADPEGLSHHRFRAAIKHNALASDLPHAWVATPPIHLLDPERMRELYAELPDVAGPFGKGRGEEVGALRRTLEIAELCRFTPPLGGVLFPKVQLDAGETPYSRLSTLAFEGATQRYRPLRPEVLERLGRELAAIQELGYASYFLLVRRIADFARDEGIPFVGRGSAADSLVAHCLGLTDADPLRYGLPFERFLNPVRRDRPDIDLDFCWRRRDEVLEHVGEMFGTERTAMISTLNRFGVRSAFREAALAEGIAPVEANRWSKRLPWSLGGGSAPFDGAGEESGRGEETGGARRGPGGTPLGRVGARDGRRGASGTAPPNPIAHALTTTPECRGFPFEDPRYQRILHVAAALLGAPRHLGLHPGGVVVAPGPITDTVSCQRATKGAIVTQLDKHGVEAIGLVKMDLLGNRALTVIDDCLRSIAKDTGDAPDLTHVHEDDPATARLLAHGRTIGCFQVESPGMRHLLQQIGSTSMDDVIQAVALIRPGPAGSGMKDAFIRRFRGLEPASPPHPLLENLLRETHGVMLYQEDVMHAVALLAGMELAEADELRRALSKPGGASASELRAAFLRACEANGIDRAPASKVWETIANFSSFGFCKAHAVTYGRIAYRTVYLKAHHPAAYLTAFLNSQTGYYATRVYVEEARRFGISILPPDVNRSAPEFTLERGAIRVGLARIRGLRETTLESLIEERERGGPFLSLPDFLDRTRAHQDETRNLIQCGAFDAFDRTRPEMLWRLHLCTSTARHPPKDAARGEAPLDPALLAACRTTPEQRARTGGWSRPFLGLAEHSLEAGEQATLFPDPPTPPLALPSLPEVDPTTRGRLELELLGLTIGAHPTALFRGEADERAGANASNTRNAIRCECAQLSGHVGERVLLRGWLAASRRVRTESRRPMCFLTLEDETGIAEVVLFPDVYARDGHRLVEHGPYIVSGTVEERMGACTLHAEALL
ncbi:MAG TPA: DNA polymerase III subunit alpha [Planctomycetes bacterium]|nr:DNA polymerase III subunit alpha [Planctomycetota bacterium]